MNALSFGCIAAYVAAGAVMNLDFDYAVEEKDPARRFKMFRVIGAGEDPVTKWNNWQMAIHFSADGIHWGEPVAKTGRVVDRSTVFWNPFRQVHAPTRRLRFDGRG